MWIIFVALAIVVILVISQIMKYFESKKSEQRQSKAPEPQPPSSSKPKREKTQKEIEHEKRKKRIRREKLTEIKGLTNSLPAEIRDLVPPKEKLDDLRFKNGELWYRSADNTVNHELFINAPHPFINKYSEPDNKENVLKRILEYIDPTDGNFIFWDFKTDGTFLETVFEYSSPYRSYIETERDIFSKWFWQDSYHDGGGSWGVKWSLVKADDSAFEGEAITENSYKDFHLPPCEEARINGELILLKSPFGMNGVFSFFSESSDRDSYDDKEIINSIGKKEIER